MSAMNDKKLVLEQYNNAKNLQTRISIHEKYSVNKMGFGNWIISNYQIEDGMRVLELGCGDGSMWRNHLDVMKRCQEFLMTDLSVGMLETAHENVGDISNVTYQVVDIQDIPFEENSFDVVIANMMLYHVSDLGKGLSEVARVLKPNGKFYCATGGERNVMQFVADLLKPYGFEYHANNQFTLQNGEKKLKEHFSQVEKKMYEDELEVTNIDDLMDYVYSVYSGISMSKICKLDRKKVREILQGEIKNGILTIPKECGMFICEC